MDPKSPTPEGVSNLRTYKQDLSESLSGEGVSQASIVMAEQSKNETEILTVAKEIRLSKTLVVGIAAFTFIGAIILAFVLFLWQREPAPAPANPTGVLPAGLIATPLRELFDVTGMSSGVAYKELATKISTGDVSTGKIKEIIPVRVSETPTGKVATYLSSEELWSTFGIKAPDRLQRFLDTPFMLGTYAGVRSAGFLVLLPLSYGPTYAEMLAWEADMPATLIPLLSGRPVPATLTWQDKVVRNIDVREAVDAEGKTQLLYSFLPVRGNLLVTPDEETFAELLTRIQTPATTLQ